MIRSLMGELISYLGLAQRQAKLSDASSVTTHQLKGKGREKLSVIYNIGRQSSHFSSTQRWAVYLGQKNGFGSSRSEGSFRVVWRAQKTSFKFIDP